MSFLDHNCPSTKHTISDLLAIDLIEEQSQCPNNILVEEIGVPAEMKVASSDSCPRREKGGWDSHVCHADVAPPTVHQEQFR